MQKNEKGLQLVAQRNVSFWVKNGSDKRKVFSNTELRVMMQHCGTLSADYTGIGSGIMRAMKSYDKILFQSNTDTEEFVITILRDETFGGTNSKNDTVNLQNEGVNEIFERVQQQNEGIRTDFEGINEEIKEDLRTIYLFLKENQSVKHANIKQIVKKSDATIERYLEILKDNGLIEYVASKKTGGYRVVYNNIALCNSELLKRISKL